MKLFAQRQLGGSVSLFDRDPNGEDAVNRAVVATFTNDTLGAGAFAIFVRGMVSLKGASLFDCDAGNFMVGDLSQLDG